LFLFEARVNFFCESTTCFCICFFPFLEKIGFLHRGNDSVGFLHCTFSEISVLSYRGSALAEFLTDGDPGGGLKKSVTELQEYDPKAVQLCRRLATHYSKQLFEIYKNKEDPLFLPS
jgi:hypothetical protein